MNMDSENSVPFTMPVAPAGYGNGGMGGFGGDWAWIIILLLAFNGGWGMGGFGGGWGGMMGLGYDFPWLLNGQNMINANTNSGFDHAATQTALGDLSTAVTAGFGNVQNSLCSGFAGVTAAVNGAQNAVSQQLYTNQIADMQQSFALQSQLANCCCENRAATQDLKYTLATEACNTRSANTANTQAILDKLCQLELDNAKREASDLRQQLAMANLAASQVAQTAELRQSGATQLNQLVSELRSCPIPSYSVYGMTPVYSCNGNSGCGCGAI